MPTTPAESRRRLASVGLISLSTAVSKANEAVSARATRSFSQRSSKAASEGKRIRTPARDTSATVTISSRADSRPGQTVRRSFSTLVSPDSAVSGEGLSAIPDSLLHKGARGKRPSLCLGSNRLGESRETVRAQARGEVALDAPDQPGSFEDQAGIELHRAG